MKRRCSCCGVTVNDDREHKLPATVTFVTLVGAIIAAGWLLMFVLTVERW